MTQRIYEGPIDEAAVLAWGYDEDLLFADQDEDVVLGAHEEVFPALARLARDLGCPKADYALSIVDFNLMFLTLRQQPDAAERIHRVLQLFEGASRPEIEEFRQVNLLRLELIRGEPNMTRERALQLGNAALNGISRNVELSLAEEDESWVVELSAPPFHRHKEWLYIDKETGDFMF